MHTGIIAEVIAAQEAANKKHGENSTGILNADDSRWLTILVEEVGEVAHALTYDANISTDFNTRSELIDVITVAVAWVEAIDREANKPRTIVEVKRTYLDPL